MPVFSDIFIPQQQLEAPTVALLQTWFPTFLKRIEIQLSLEIGSIKPPAAKNYTSRNKFDALAGEDTPKVVVVSPGIIGTPLMSGNRQIRATWRLGIGVACVATTEETAKLHGDIYGAAVREIMLKKGGGALGGHIHWLDEQYTDLPISEQLNQFRAAAIWFSVDIENVATKRGGPDVPDADPYAYHTADTIDIDLNKEPITNG